MWKGLGTGEAYCYMPALSAELRLRILQHQRLLGHAAVPGVLSFVSHVLKRTGGILCPCPQVYRLSNLSLGNACGNVRNAGTKAGTNTTRTRSNLKRIKVKDVGLERAVRIA